MMFDVCFGSRADAGTDGWDRQLRASSGLESACPALADGSVLTGR